MKPRRFAFSLALVVALAPRARGDDLAPRVEGAISRGTRALVLAQSPDGAWRSRTYGAFKDGASLTPSVLKAVAFAPDVEGADASKARGAAYLAGHARPDGSIGYRGAVYYQSAAPAWQRLNAIAGVFEFEVDAQGNTKGQLWEWK